MVRVRVLGIQVNRSSISLLRLHHPSLRPEHHTEIVVRVGVLRVERDRALVRAGRPVQLESILQHDAQVAVPVRPPGLELEASLDQRDRLLALRLLVGEHPREVQGIRAVGRDVEDAAVDVRSGRPLLVLLQDDGDRDRLVHAQPATAGGQLLHRVRRERPVVASRVRLPCSPGCRT